MNQKDYEAEAGRVIDMLDANGVPRDEQVVVLSQALGERLGARMDGSGSILHVLNIAMNHAWQVACLTAGQVSVARRLGGH